MTLPVITASCSSLRKSDSSCVHALDLTLAGSGRAAAELPDFGTDTREARHTGKLGLIPGKRCGEKKPVQMPWLKGVASANSELVTQLPGAKLARVARVKERGVEAQDCASSPSIGPSTHVAEAEAVDSSHEDARSRRSMRRSRRLFMPPVRHSKPSVTCAHASPQVRSAHREKQDQAPGGDSDPDAHCCVVHTQTHGVHLAVPSRAAV